MKPPILVARCFLCLSPTTRIVSTVIPDHPPVSQQDAVAICPRCKPDWNFALLAPNNPPTEISRP